MPSKSWNWLAEFRKLWETPEPEPTQHALRVLRLKRSIILPAKLVILAVVIYYLFYSQWIANELDLAREFNPGRARLLVLLRHITIAFTVANALVLGWLFIVRRLPQRRVRALALCMGLLDGLYLAAMTQITGGFESQLYWAFPVLIIFNAFSIPLAAPQIMLNLALSAFYLGAGIWSLNTEIAYNSPEHTHPIKLDESTTRTPAGKQHLRQTVADDGNRSFGLQLPLRNLDTFLLRIILLWLLTASSYGAQVLAARQRQVEDEAREFATRQAQLRMAGRLSAEIAHQIKNPLAIINNTTFSLRRALAAGKTDVSSQLLIIQEEIERSDRIITQLMGYARLSEGRVEKVSMTEELDRAVAEVFPPASGFEIKVQRDYAIGLPSLVMQRGHLNTILVNLLQNAREALHGRGNISITARPADNYSIEVILQDDGPGIPAEQSERIFEAYYTTKEKGTGLGLSIVKHNVDLYGGQVRMESELGKGARFVLLFPARALNNDVKNA